MNIGPLQLVVVGFEGDVMETNVIDELFAATTAGDIRLIDLLVAEKDEYGRVWTSEISDLTYEEEVRYGALIGGLIGLGALGPEGVEAGAQAGAEAVTQSHSVLGLTPIEVNDLVFNMPKGHSGIVALFEHTWAADLYAAQVNARGMILVQALIEPQGLVLLGAEMEAAMEAAGVVEAAEEAAAAVVIWEEAARQAVTGLLAAEMIDEAAAEEAREVVMAAWAADAAAQQAAEEDDM